MRFSIAALSNAGACRTVNEDFVLVQPSVPLVVVSDGSGGLITGVLAAQVAAHLIQAAALSGAMTGEGLKRALVDANTVLRDLLVSEGHSVPEQIYPLLSPQVHSILDMARKGRGSLHGSGAAVVAALLRDDRAYDDLIETPRDAPRSGGRLRCQAAQTCAPLAAPRSQVWHHDLGVDPPLPASFRMVAEQSTIVGGDVGMCHTVRRFPRRGRNMGSDPRSSGKGGIESTMPTPDGITLELTAREAREGVTREVPVPEEASGAPSPGGACTTVRVDIPGGVRTGMVIAIPAARLPKERRAGAPIFVRLLVDGDAGEETATPVRLSPGPADRRRARRIGWGLAVVGAVFIAFAVWSAVSQIGEPSIHLHPTAFAVGYLSLMFGLLMAVMGYDLNMDLGRAGRVKLLGLYLLGAAVCVAAGISMWKLLVYIAHFSYHAP